MHSVVSVCVYPGRCFTIVDVGGQQLENRWWVAGTDQLASSWSINLDFMRLVLSAMFLLKFVFQTKDFR